MLTRALLVTILCAGCNAGEAPFDSGFGDGPPIDAVQPDKKVEIRASVNPTRARPEDELHLQVVVVGFRLVPLSEPAQAGRGHYMVSLVDLQGDALMSLLQGSIREERFRLDDLPSFVAPPSGDYGLRLSLHLNDGKAVHAEAWVTLPFELYAD